MMSDFWNSSVKTVKFTKERFERAMETAAERLEYYPPQPQPYVICHPDDYDFWVNLFNDLRPEAN